MASVACVDEATVMDLVNDSAAFERCVEQQFEMLDGDGDGVLSRQDLQSRSGKLSSTDCELQSKEEIASVYDTLFDKFDSDRNGVIDRQEFTAMMKELMLAKARGLGNSPVLIILHADSTLMKAVEHHRHSSPNPN